MSGPLVFRTSIKLPPGDQPFLNRVQLAGDFGITGSEISEPGDAKTGETFLSARALGEADKVEDKDDKLGNDSYDPGRVLSNLKGHVTLRDADRTPGVGFIHSTWSQGCGERHL